MTENELLGMRKTASKKFDLNNIDPEFVAELIFNSLSFENRFISLEEVKRILKEDTVGLDEKKIISVNNQKNAFFAIVELVKNKEELTESKLKDIHQLLMNGNGGLYRNVDISIQGSAHTPPSHIKVYDRMKKYFDSLSNFEGDTLEKVSFSHLQLSKIHPFLDGNGRLARLILNYHMMMNGLNPIIFPVEEKEHYFNHLEEFKVNKNIKPFAEYIMELEQEILA